MTLVSAGEDEKKWYFNTRTNEPEYGRHSKWDEIMGPYDSREEALHAWERVRARNEEWLDQERQWHPHTEAQWQPFDERVNDPEQPNPAEEEMKEREEAVAEEKPLPKEPEEPETPAALL